MAPQASPHLSDSEIDAYWMGHLAAGDVERVELHYLDCTECRERAAAVELLVASLRLDHTPAAQPSLRAWQVAAAVFALVAVGATWQWGRLARVTGPTGVPPASVVRADAGAPASLRVTVAPPTRSAPAAGLTVPAGVTIVVFDLDVREVAAPNVVLHVALTGPDGRVMMRMEARSSADARMAVPVHRDVLAPGRFQFDVSHRDMTVTLPVVIQPASPHQ